VMALTTQFSRGLVGLQWSDAFLLRGNALAWPWTTRVCHRPAGRETPTTANFRFGVVVTIQVTTTFRYPSAFDLSAL